MDLGGKFPMFYEVSSQILALYRKRIEGLPKLPFERVRKAAGGQGGIYLLYGPTGMLLHVGMSIDLRKRLSAWKSWWRKHRPVGYESRVTVSLILLPPENRWPITYRGEHKFHRIEWFIQLAMRSVDIQGLEGDPFLFWNDGPPAETSPDPRIREQAEFASPT